MDEVQVLQQQIKHAREVFTQTHEQRARLTAALAQSNARVVITFPDVDRAVAQFMVGTILVGAPFEYRLAFNPLHWVGQGPLPLREIPCE
jgi:hypothetical protein